MDDPIPTLNSLSSLDQVEAHLRLLQAQISDNEIEDTIKSLPKNNITSAKKRKTLASTLRQEKLNNHHICWSSVNFKNDVTERISKLALDTFILIKTSMSDMDSNFNLPLFARITLECLSKEISNFESYNDPLTNSKGVSSNPYDISQIQALCIILESILDHISPSEFSPSLFLLIIKILKSVEEIDSPFVIYIVSSLNALNRFPINEQTSRFLFNIISSFLKLASTKSSISEKCIENLSFFIKNSADDKNSFLNILYQSISCWFDRVKSTIVQGEKTVFFKHFLIALRGLLEPFCGSPPYFLRLILQISYLMLVNPPIFIARECIITALSLLSQFDNLDISSKNYINTNAYPVLLTLSAASLKLGSSTPGKSGRLLKLTTDDLTFLFHLCTLNLSLLFSLGFEEIQSERDEFFFKTSVTRVSLNLSRKDALALLYLDTCNTLSLILDARTAQVDLSSYISQLASLMVIEWASEYDIINAYLKIPATLKNWVNLSQAETVYSNLISSLRFLSDKFPPAFFQNYNIILFEVVPLLFERFQTFPSVALEELFASLARSYGVPQLIELSSDEPESNKLGPHFLYPILEQGLRGAPLMYFIQSIIPAIHKLQEQLSPLLKLEDSSLRSAEKSRKESFILALNQLYKLGPAFCREPPDIVEALEFNDFLFPKFLVECLGLECTEQQITTACKALINLSDSISKSGTNCNRILHLFSPFLAQVVRMFVNSYRKNKKSRLSTYQPLKEAMKACAKFVPPQTLKSNLISFETEWTRIALSDEAMKTRSAPESASVSPLMDSVIGSALVEVARVHFSFIDAFAQIKLYESFVNLFKSKVPQGIKAVTDVLDFTKEKLFSHSPKLQPLITCITSIENMEMLMEVLSSIPVHLLTKNHYKFLNSFTLLLSVTSNVPNAYKQSGIFFQKHLDNLIKIIVASANELHAASKKAIMGSFTNILNCSNPLEVFNLIAQRTVNVRNNDPLTTCTSICIFNIFEHLIETTKDISICLEIVRKISSLIDTKAISFLYALKIIKKIITSNLLVGDQLEEEVLPYMFILLDNEQMVSKHRIQVKRLLSRVAARVDHVILWKHIPPCAAGLLSSAIKTFSKIGHKKQTTSSIDESCSGDESPPIHPLDTILGYKIANKNKDKTKTKAKKEKTVKKTIKKIEKKNDKQPFKYIKLSKKMMHEKNKNETIKKLSATN